MTYTPDQVKDIQEREKKALEMLKELQLNPSATVQAHNLGDDVFGMKVTPYLADLKYVPANPSPESQAEEKKDEPAA